MTEEIMYTPEQVAKRWQISKSAAHQILRGKPGVLQITSGVNTKKRSTRHLVRIPESVLERVEEEFRAKPVQNRYKRSRW